MQDTLTRFSDGRRATTALLAALLTALVWTGCTKSISDSDLVLVSPSQGMELAEGRKTLLGLGEVEKAAWVDPRGGRAYREGHIPGALHVPFQDLNDQQEMLRGYNTLIVYGTDFHDALADGMSKRLMELGFRDVRTLKGGLRAWTRAGYEAETGPPATGTAP